MPYEFNLSVKTPKIKIIISAPSGAAGKDLVSDAAEKLGFSKSITRTERKLPTDVLSFPFYEDLRPGKLPCPLHRDELNLGDVFLGVEFVMRQCQESSLDLHEALTVITARDLSPVGLQTRDRGRVD